jgi:glycosyltransferase involved in cell wall biosynthesis
MSIPDVSVVMSVRNRSALLLDCLRGLADQTLPRHRFELLLVDNMSSEDLLAVAERGRREFGLNVRYTRTTADNGPAPARNLGVSLAVGRIIAFTDSDCRPSPNWLASGLAEFADPAVALVTGPVLPKPGQPITLTSKITFITHNEHPTFPTANAFYRRTVFESFGGFDISLSFRDPFDRSTECSDTDFAWRVIKAGHARRFASDAVIYHEVEELGVWRWMIEPTRLFVLPALIRRHPELRAELLHCRIFFHYSSWLLYVGIVCLVAGALLWPWILLALPLLLLARGVQRTGSFNPLVLARFSARVLIELPRIVLLDLSLIYGSVRFGALVL